MTRDAASIAGAVDVCSAGVYAGDTKNWRRVGGRDLPITVITREEGAGTRAAFETLVMDWRRIAASALVEDSTGAVRQMVASDAAAIGYVSIGLVNARSSHCACMGSRRPKRTSLDERCIHMLALRQPAASDLRFIAAALKMVTDLDG